MIKFKRLESAMNRNSMRGFSSLIYKIFIVAGITTSCLSPRESCEYYEEVDGGFVLCSLMLYSAASCVSQLAAGKTAQQQCNQVEAAMLVTCASYIQDRNKCQSQIDWPKP
jgi:hypothetical protein